MCLFDCGSLSSMWDLQFSLLHIESFGFGVWDLAPWLGIEPRSPALGAQSLSHGAASEAPVFRETISSSYPLSRVSDHDLKYTF